MSADKYVLLQGTPSLSLAQLCGMTTPACLPAWHPQVDPTWNLDRIDQQELPLDHLYHYDATGTGVNV